jgi:hypothetical protein
MYRLLNCLRNYVRHIFTLWPQHFQSSALRIDHQYSSARISVHSHLGAVAQDSAVLGSLRRVGTTEHSLLNNTPQQDYEISQSGFIITLPKDVRRKRGGVYDETLQLVADNFMSLHWLCWGYGIGMVWEEDGFWALLIERILMRYEVCDRRAGYERDRGIGPHLIGFYREISHWPPWDTRFTTNRLAAFTPRHVNILAAINANMICPPTHPRFDFVTF